jgi:hypothetical protein
LDLFQNKIFKAKIINYGMRAFFYLPLEEFFQYEDLRRYPISPWSSSPK